MTKFTLLFALIFTTQVSANPIARRLFRVPAESQAHSMRGAASEYQFTGPVKVLVWNIKKSEERNWKPEFETYSQDRDLVLIQEAYANKVFNGTLDEILGFRWDMGESFQVIRSNSQPTGVMIGSKVDPLELEVAHSPDNEPFTNTPKASLFAVYPFMNQELLVVTVHGINFTTTGAFRRQMREIEERINKHQGPVLWAGDFNTHLNGRMSFLRKLVQKLNFITVEFKNGERRSRFKPTGNYFDHAFVRGLNVENAEVVVESKGSDHKPLLLEINI